MVADSTSHELQSVYAYLQNNKIISSPSINYYNKIQLVAYTIQYRHPATYMLRYIYACRWTLGLESSTTSLRSNSASFLELLTFAFDCVLGGLLSIVLHCAYLMWAHLDMTIIEILSDCNPETYPQNAISNPSQTMKVPCCILHQDSSSDDDAD